MIASARTSHLQGCIDRLAMDDVEARDELIAHSCERLRVMSRRLSRGDRVRRFVDTDDVLQGAVLTLRESLRSARPASVADFLRLAAFQIRRELIRLAREYYGPMGWGTRHILCPSVTGCRGEVAVDASIEEASPIRAASVQEEMEILQSAVDALPDDLRDVVELLWLHGLSQQEVADILDITVRTVRRRWVRSRLRLHRELSGSSSLP